MTLALAGAFAGLSGGTAAAAPCTVPGTHPTISAAVADPGCDPIDVAAGTYNEQVTITRTLTLRGAQQGVDARTRSGAESIITNSCGPIQIEADNVKIDGFTITGSTQADPCFISGIWTNPGFSGTQGGHTIVNNIVRDNISGIELDSTCTNPTLVQHNLIRDNNEPGPGSGNAIQTNFGLCNATIDANLFSGPDNSSMLVFGGSSDIDFTNNGLVGGANEGVAWFGVSNSSVTGNTSIGTGASATVDLAGGNSNIAVDNNILANGVRGISVSDPFSVGPNSGVSAQGNCIQGNTTAGLDVPSGGYSPVAPNSLDARNNWWGSPPGPTIASNPGGSGDKIIDPDGVVAYTPFSTTAPSGCPPPAPRADKRNVRDEINAAIPGASKGDADKLKDAAKKLTDSLDPSLWIDDSHLQPKGGEKVFDREKDAVGKLVDILKDTKGNVPDATVQGWISRLVADDRKLAQTAIDEATAANGDAKKLADANSEMSKGDADAAAGRPTNAIEHYRNAWKKAKDSVS